MHLCDFAIEQRSDLTCIGGQVGALVLIVTYFIDRYTKH